jgi:hypothetical protein
MQSDIFKDPQYTTLMKRHIYELLSYLLSENSDFSIVSTVAPIDFNPTLPQAIKEKFDEKVMFVIGGYTKESAYVDSDALYFEAGFGEDNFGSKLTIPLLSIKQLFLDENPILLNFIRDEEIAQTKDPKSDLQNSMAALLNNPNNHALKAKLAKKKS